MHWWLKQKRITSIKNLVAHNRPVFESLLIIGQNQFSHGENEWDFYFQNPTVAHY